jgi:transcriptional regulator with XRE-family HTH domain
LHWPCEWAATLGRIEILSIPQLRLHGRLFAEMWEPEMQRLDGYWRDNVTKSRTDTTPLGRRVDQAIKARYIRQDDLAYRVGIPRVRLYRWRMGMMTPSAADLDALARELRVDRRWLETGAGEMEIQPASMLADLAESPIPADWVSRPVTRNGDSTSAAGDLGWPVQHINGTVPEVQARGTAMNTNRTDNPQIGDATYSGPPAASLNPRDDKLVDDLLKTVREMAALREMWATARELATASGRKIELTLKSSRAAGAGDPKLVATLTVTDQK